MLKRLKDNKSCLRPNCDSTDFIVRNIHGEVYICKECGCIVNENGYSFHVPDPDIIIKEDKIWVV